MPPSSGHPARAGRLAARRSSRLRCRSAAAARARRNPRRASQATPRTRHRRAIAVRPDCSRTTAVWSVNRWHPLPGRTTPSVVRCGRSMLPVRRLPASQARCLSQCGSLGAGRRGKARRTEPRDVPPARNGRHAGHRSGRRALCGRSWHLHHAGGLCGSPAPECLQAGRDRQAPSARSAAGSARTRPVLAGRSARRS